MMRILLTITVFLLSYVLRGQQEYDESTKNSALPSAEGYQQRSKDERYEGLYIKKVSSQTELLSLTIGKINYEMDKNEKLIIQAPNVNKKIGVTGKSFGLNIYYRLDLTLNNKLKKEIPIKDVIGKIGVKPRNIGIYGYIGKSNNPSAYVPVYVSSKNTTDTTGKDYNLILMSNSKMSKINWQYSVVSQNGSCNDFKKASEIDSKGLPFFSGNPIFINMDNLKNEKDGTEVCIQINMLNSFRNIWENFSFKMILP